MGWLIANAFLLIVVLTAAGYTWLVFALLKLLGLHEYSIVVVAGFAVALFATYHTTKALHRLIAARI